MDVEFVVDDPVAANFYSKPISTGTFTQSLSQAMQEDGLQPGTVEQVEVLNAQVVSGGHVPAPSSRSCHYKIIARNI